MKTLETLDSGSACPRCQQPVGLEDVFCGNCGYDLKHPNPEKNDDVFSALNPMLLYYFTTLFLLATYKFTEAFPLGLNGMIYVTMFDILIVIAFWVYYHKEIRSLFSISAVTLKMVLFTVAGAIIGSVVVSVVARFINLSINDDVFYNTYLFQDTKYPFLLATLFIAVQPAVFEEIAFRGFLFDNLRGVAHGKSAIYVTGILFGIIHLQFISLLWLVPIGLAFGYLRYRYNTLWYGVIGHFTYNFCIVLFEFKNWF